MWTVQGLPRRHFTIYGGSVCQEDLQIAVESAKVYRITQCWKYLQRFVAVDWTEQTTWMLWPLACACTASTLESSARLDAQAHAMGRRRIIARAYGCQSYMVRGSKLSEASFVRRRVAAQASRPTSGLRAIGIPVWISNHGALLLL